MNELVNPVVLNSLTPIDWRCGDIDDELDDDSDPSPFDPEVLRNALGVDVDELFASDEDGETSRHARLGPPTKASLVVVSHPKGKSATYLLGLTGDAGNDRAWKWCFPGGEVKPTENFFDAAERMCREEAWVNCRVTKDYLFINGKPEVAFVKCVADHRFVLRPGHEFSVFGWFTAKEIKKSANTCEGVESVIKSFERGGESDRTINLTDVD